MMTAMVHSANRRYHDRVAGRYDMVYDTAYWRFYRDLSWRHLKRFLPTSRPARAADLGCGTGHFGVRMLRSGLEVVFLDPSGNMIGRAQQAAEAEDHRNLPSTFVQAGMEDMGDIDSGSIDFVTAQGDPLSFCEDPRKGLRELHRIMAPGAVAVLSVDSRVAGVRSLLERDKPAPALELLRTGRTEWMGDRAEERFPMKMFDPDELDDLLRKTGFQTIDRIAKTCLVQRRQEAWLEDPKLRKKLMQDEEKIHGQAHWFAVAGHFQVAARKVEKGAAKGS